MLELRAVSATYGQVTAVRDLSITVEPGETVALVGRNGSGKTTTLRLVSGVLAPTTGDVRWNGRSLLGLPPEARVKQGIVLVPEGRGIFPALSVEENVRLGAYWRRPGLRQLRRELAELYELLPILGERAGQTAGSLSGGQQQLLAIGRALLSRPQLLLLDEPSLGLSPMMVQALYDLLGKLKDQGVGFILVEQFVPLALKLCDRVVGLKKGVVALAGTSGDMAHGDLAEVYMGGQDLEAQAISLIEAS